jgi:HAD superfamily hydrolase (TIGR01549 family)
MSRAGANVHAHWRGVIFDMDGTLTVPVIDFAAMRLRLGIPSGDILHTLKSWPEDRRQWALIIIEEIEAEAVERMAFQAGCLDLLDFLETFGLPRAILTRNTQRTVEVFMARLGRRFDVVITREFEPVKPAPDSALHICERWRVAPERVLLVGDYRDDILCGRAAGTRTCLLKNAHNEHYADLADYAVAGLDAVVGILSSPPPPPGGGPNQSHSLTKGC